MKPGIDYIGISTPFFCHDGKGNFVLHKRSKNCRDEIGCWDSGGGQLEFGLTLEENVLKEVHEEYGCKGIIEQQLPSHSLLRDNQGKKTHWLIVTFIIQVNRDFVRNNEPDKIDEIAWFRLTMLPKPLHSGFYYTFHHYQEYFQNYRQKR